VIEQSSGARRALEWFLNRTNEEPSDQDIEDFRWFLELIIEGESDHVTLPDWERTRGAASGGDARLN
jgi:hypothetical protein